MGRVARQKRQGHQEATEKYRSREACEDGERARLYSTSRGWQMSDVKRFQINQPEPRVWQSNAPPGTMQIWNNPEGDWVRASDYDALAAELERERAGGTPCFMGQQSARIKTLEAAMQEKSQLLQRIEDWLRPEVVKEPDRSFFWKIVELRRKHDGQPPATASETQGECPEPDCGQNQSHRCAPKTGAEQ